MKFAGYLGCVALTLIGLWSGWLEPIDNALFDHAVRLHRSLLPRPVDIDVVVVGIDDAFVDGIDEPLALSHIHLGRFLTLLADAPPRVLGIDLVLPEKRFDNVVSRRDPGLDYHRALLQGLFAAAAVFPVVLSKVWNAEAQRFGDIQLDYRAALDISGDARNTIASSMVCPDRDGTVRRYPGPWCQPDASADTFVARIAHAAGKDSDWKGRINFTIGEPFHYIPLQDVLAQAEREGSDSLRPLFADRIVLLGVTTDYEDILEAAVPLTQWRGDDRRLPGVLLHAQMIRSIFNQGLLGSAPTWLASVLVLLASGLWFGRRVALKLVSLVLLLAITGLCAIMLLDREIWLPAAAILVALCLSTAARVAWQAWLGFRERLSLLRTFKGYVSPSVLREILAGKLETNSAGQSVEITVLFADVRGFTTLSEKFPAAQVVTLLNRIFEEVVAVVHQYGGTVDKFIGDGVMAIFGAPNPLASAEQNALSAARELLLRMAAVNASLRAEGGPEIAIGIGLHRGPAVVGNVGARDRFEYTAIGDTVNTASRLEGC